MFGGLGGALKSLSGKAEEMIEKTKTSVGEIAAEKKAAAAAMLEGQAKKTSDLLWQTKTNAETGVSEVVAEGKAAAIDGFDKEVANAEKLVEEGMAEKTQEKPSESTTDTKKSDETTPPNLGNLSIDPAKLLAGSALAGGLGNVDKEVEKAVDGAIKEVSTVVDNKIKETDQFLDEKREQVVNSVQEETQKTASTASEGFSSVLGKAKGLLNF